MRLGPGEGTRLGVASPGDNSELLAPLAELGWAESPLVADLPLLKPDSRLSRWMLSGSGLSSESVLPSCLMTSLRSEKSEALTYCRQQTKKPSRIADRRVVSSRTELELELAPIGIELLIPKGRVGLV